jgi:hypothetical protein
MSERRRKTAFHLDMALVVFWISFIVVALATAPAPR